MSSASAGSTICNMPGGGGVIVTGVAGDVGAVTVEGVVGVVES